MRRERGLVLIIAYKLGKGGLWLVIVAVLLVFMHLGLSDDLLGVAEHLRMHARVWSLKLADVVVRAASRRGLWTITVALVVDGAFSLVEGWALPRGQVWGKWLVVVSTGSFLPFEVIALARHPHVVRAALLAVNLVIVVYLARKARLEGAGSIDASGTDATPL